jgi:GAF domain-containing protein
MSRAAGSARERLVSRAFVSLADTLVDEYDIIELLARLVGHCVELLDADAAGILLTDPHQQLRVVAASSEDAELMELLQLQADQGPCVDCFRTGAPVSAPDLAEAGARWPRFVAEVARRAPFRAVHALPLRLRGESIGAMNLFHHEPGTMAAADLDLGQALADIATIGILSGRAIRRSEVLNEQLQTALNSRVTIEQAKGVLAQYSGLGMDAAFAQLRNYSRGHNRRLSEVARLIVEGALDPALLRTDAPSAPTPARAPRRH